MQKFIKEEFDNKVGFLDQAGRLVRLIASVIGMILIIAGLIYALKLFNLVFDNLSSPQNFIEIFKPWIEVVGGDAFNFRVAGKPYPVANVITLGVLGAGGFLLAWIAMGLMLTGAKIVSWTTSDREAILKILNHVFGVVAVKRGRLYGDS